MRRLRFLIPALALAAPLALAGCKQGVGDRCQTNDDCDSGFCILPPGGSSLTGGTCQAANADLGVDLAAPAQDLTVPDDLTSSPDLTSPPDLSGQD